MPAGVEIDFQTQESLSDPAGIDISFVASARDRMLAEIQRRPRRAPKHGRAGEHPGEAFSDSAKNNEDPSEARQDYFAFLTGKDSATLHTTIL
jgi:hypothetical protein